MSVTETSKTCTAAACVLPSEEGPGCGCSSKATKVSAPVDGKVAGAAAMSALAAVACTSCCVLPFVLPAVVLAGIGGGVAVLDHAHGWVTRAAVVAVICAWIWLGFQMVRHGRKPARAAVIMMTLATLLTGLAASWPVLEPMVFHALGIVKKRPASPGG